MVSSTTSVVTYSNKQISYLSAGPSNGPLLIFLHGWPAIAATWKPQVECFAALGFRVIAPDMPGYGASTANKVTEDYSMESINDGLLALLHAQNKDKAVWLGHDWGAGILSGFVAVYPEHVHAACWMAVPYGTIEYGLENLVQHINRDIYPEAEYPYAQWDYQKYYEESFEEATAYFEKYTEKFLAAGYAFGSPAGERKPAITATVRRDHGWMGGVEPPAVPLAYTSLSEEMHGELTAAMKKTGFFGADSYYMNHGRNRAYIMEKRKGEGVLKMPTLFVQARWDHICDTHNSTLLEPMKKMCENLKFVSVDAGHWVALEKPAETNAAILKWLAEDLGGLWPVRVEKL